MLNFKTWWDKSVFSCGLPLHQSTARAAWEAATLAERERCAKVCEEIVKADHLKIIGKAFAEAIRKGE